MAYSDYDDLRVESEHMQVVVGYLHETRWVGLFAILFTLFAVSRSMAVDEWTFVTVGTIGSQYFCAGYYAWLWRHHRRENMARRVVARLRGHQIVDNMIVRPDIKPEPPPAPPPNRRVP